MVDGINLTIPANRTQSINRFCENHTDHKRGSVSAVFSRMITKVAKEASLNPADFKQQSRVKPQYNTSLNATIAPHPAAAPPGTPPPIRAGGDAPNWGPGAPPGAMPGAMPGMIPGAPMSGLTLDSIAAFFKSLYGVAQMINPDLPDMSDKEAMDLAVLWAPIMVERVQSTRAITGMAIGATVGTLGRKVGAARQKKKERDAAKKSDLPPKTPPNPDPTAAAAAGARPPAPATETGADPLAATPGGSVDTPPMGMGDLPNIEGDPNAG